MDRFDRIIELNRILAARRTGISRKALEDEMEASRATVNRAIRYLRDHLNAPLEYDRKRGGYFYDDTGERPFELPGLWFNSDELFALLTTHHLLSSIQPGVLDEYLRPFINRIEALLPRLVGEGDAMDWAEITRRVQIRSHAARPTDVTQFRRISGGLMRRLRLRVLYHGRARDETSERVISPQRLVYYRDNWYLDAWCHASDAWRRFSVDRMHVVDALDEAAKEIPAERLREDLEGGFGIFRGRASATARLRFSSEAAKWVADEHWHADQRLTVRPDGGCDLTVPYSDPRELLRQILWYGADVEVLAPDALRQAVAEAHERAAAVYLGKL